MTQAVADNLTQLKTLLEATAHPTEEELGIEIGSGHLDSAAWSTSPLIRLDQLTSPIKEAHWFH